MSWDRRHGRQGLRKVTKILLQFLVLLSHHRQMLQKWPQRQGGKIAKCRNNQRGGSQQYGKRPGVRRQCARTVWSRLLGGEKTCQPKRRDRQGEAAYHHGYCGRQVVKKSALMINNATFARPTALLISSRHSEPACNLLSSQTSTSSRSSGFRWTRTRASQS